ncbi:tyrosine--tRNA ligase [Microgenomates group bacterium RBG_16_45_19]|nr:MAG: tyrosine--tRNA ligase [Microgenomates group bacterium RBG_16_45_19]
MDQIDELLSRRVDTILPSKAGLKKLLQTKKIRLYQGFDPTASHLHLGHTVGLHLLMAFARAGHEVIILFGTGTVLVGDPSLRENARQLITSTEINQNLSTWKDQVAPIVDFSQVSIKQNSDWLVPLTLKDIIKIASHISAVQLFKRDSFQRRLQRGDTVWYHETMYPLLQGYDSVVMDVDLEVGGTDQEFNMLIGRELQRKMNQRDKYVLTVPMILGTDGKTMSKTSGNCIYLDDTPNDKFAKIMSLIDSQIIPYLKLITHTPLAQVEQLEKDLHQDRLHPMAAKKQLATTIVSEWHGSDLAQKAQSYFESTFQKRSVSDQTPTFNLTAPPLSLLDLLKQLPLGVSHAQLKRVISEGGVELGGHKITDPQALVSPKNGDLLQYGKHYFVQLKII